MTRVFVDTNVLFPFSLMDLMLALTEDGAHELVRTERLLDEWERVIVREQQRTPAAARSITQAIRRFFGDCRICRQLHLMRTRDGLHIVVVDGGNNPAEQESWPRVAAVTVAASAT